MSDKINSFTRRTVAPASLVAVLVCALAGSGVAVGQEQPAQVTPPQPTVPEVFTLMGQFVRVAYNNEGFATMGYRLAQEQVGKEWIMLIAGVTLRKPTPEYRLKREHIWVTTPDGTKVPLATQKEYAGGGAEARSLTRRAKAVRDSINYFPVEADQPCALQFFADPGSPGNQLAFNETVITWNRACAGRLFFKIPGGVKVGQHWLNIRFAGSELQVPFRVLTEEEEKQFRKNWQDIKKQHEAGYK